MKKDLKDPMHLAIAAVSLTLHSKLSESIREEQPDEYVYVPMLLPAGMWNELSNVIKLDSKIGSIVLASVFVAGLDAIIDEFELRNHESYREFKDALKRQTDSIKRMLDIELH